ncbi:MAG TPA: Rieske 2Fe-2S domain-containing protein [Nocardioidaceae bacterium]|nr:Rieske 2Fe-2S domain-containing protein [Nocardioidaceae bacterium]
MTEGPHPTDGHPDGAGHDLAALSPEEPIPNPGLPPHEPRPTDVDAAQERRAERQVAGMFILAALLALAFCVLYFVIPPPSDQSATFMGYGASNLALGLTLGLALLLTGAAAIQWAKKLMGNQDIIEARHSTASPPNVREEQVAAFKLGVAESGFGRRTLIRNSMFAALGMLGLPAIVLLRDLGPLPGNLTSITVWKRGIRVVNDVSGTPLRPSDIAEGQLVNAEPALFFDEVGPNGKVIKAKYTGTALNDQKAKAAVILVRMLPTDIKSAQERAWGVNGIVCFSKICTHVGCPISLYEQQTHQLLCPCHQSTFDLTEDGKVVFGPAARPLPQLPIMVDKEGYLVARSDFHQPVGPSFWERG